MSARGPIVRHPGQSKAVHLSGRDAALTLRETLQAVFDSEDIQVLADTLPARTPGSGGRPRTYPVWIYFLILVVAQHFGSVRQAIHEVGDRETWHDLQQVARERYPDMPQRWLPDAPLKRGSYLYFRDRHLLGNEPRELIRVAARVAATAHAQEMGLCRTDGSGSLTHPDEDQVVVGDGTVLPSKFKGTRKTVVRNRDTGELRTPRFDRDAREVMTGTGEKVLGCLFQIVSCRGVGENRRQILDVAPIVDRAQGGVPEGHAFVNVIAEIKELLPGIQVVVYDMAVRGVHVRRLYQLGLITVVKQFKLSGRARDRFVGSAEAIGIDGRLRTVQIHTQGAAPHIRVINVAGDIDLVPLARIRTEQRGAPGSYRIYNVYRIPESAGGGKVRLRLNQTDEDRTQKPPFNREEYLRAIPQGDPDFDRLFGLREDAESGNAWLKSKLRDGRANTVSRRRQHLDLIGHQLLRNATTLALWRRRESIMRQSAA